MEWCAGHAVLCYLGKQAGAGLLLCCCLESMGFAPVADQIQTLLHMAVGANRAQARGGTGRPQATGSGARNNAGAGRHAGV